jgi:hypothetical protein
LRKRRLITKRNDVSIEFVDVNIPGKGGKRSASRPRKMSGEHIIATFLPPVVVEIKDVILSVDVGLSAEMGNVLGFEPAMYVHCTRLTGNEWYDDAGHKLGKPGQVAVQLA